MIILNEEKGVYQRNGTDYGRVSDILKSVGIIDDRWFTEYAALRGTYVHEAIALYDQGNLDYPSLHEDLRGYVSAWMDFRKDTQFIFHPGKIEETLYSDIYKVAGTPDRIEPETSKITKDGDLAIIDAKCVTSLNPSVEIQTAGYEQMFREMYRSSNGKEFSGKIRRYAIQLFNDGRYKIKPLTQYGDALIWLSAVNIYNWKRKA